MADVQFTDSNNVNEQVKALLAQAGIKPEGTTIGADDDIKYHTNGETYIAVPDGMSMEHLADIAHRKAKELNKVHAFNHMTKYRPNDGAHAAAVVIKRMFGLSIGKAHQTMFGEEPPAYVTIDVDYNKKMDVPWGHLEIPALPGADFELGGQMTPSGPVFSVSVTSPKKHKRKIEEFFTELDHELATNSIYRGKPLRGAHELSFMNVENFKSSQIVFADHVQRTIDASINGLIEHTEATIEAGLPTKRAVLAFGSYGTGKSSLGIITAQRAKAAGWTFLTAKAGKDKLKPVLETAKLYQPAVVFVEDIDAHTPRASDTDGISELLDLFDGISTKNDKLVVIMTTNHIEKVPAGMLRPGRLDYTVNISGLDRGGVERLVKAVVRTDLLDANVDYDAVFESMEDWEPAWIKAAADRAQSFAISRSNGALTYTLTTDDLVDAANSLRPQLELMNSALEGYIEPELHEALDKQVVKSVTRAMDDVKVVDRDSDQVFAMTTDPRGHKWDHKANASN